MTIRVEKESDISRLKPSYEEIYAMTELRDNQICGTKCMPFDGAYSIHQLLCTEERTIAGSRSSYSVINSVTGDTNDSLGQDMRPKVVDPLVSLLSPERFRKLDPFNCLIVCNSHIIVDEIKTFL